ncbi:MAG: 4Fe-4S dicluster domain-containing protein [Candidatus Latescibacteria bacterium]|nr:4Fe-4S dicluster domain-containing protein [Candidatus Latescibacterota bacterium]
MTALQESAPATLPEPKRKSDPAPARFRLVKLALGHAHRYGRYRLVTMGITLAVLMAAPLAGLARVDLWSGAHRMLGDPVDLGLGLATVSVAIASFYGATFLINMIAGRMFCGFGCPVGELSRLSDAVDALAKDPAGQRRAWLKLGAFALLLVGATSLWWVAPGVYVAGGLAMLVAWGALALGVGLALIHARRWRWNFCRKLCPIGLYYSVVQTGGLVHIDYDAKLACTDCKACAGVCPVHLDPRHLDQLLDSPGGLAVSDMPAANHCLSCGACVEICEHMTRKEPLPAAMGFRSPRR